MNTLNKSTLPFCLMLAFSGISLNAYAQDVNAEREKWAVYARAGQSQLAESVAALRKLYAETNDRKVRADLIALLIRQGNGAEALRVCDNCKPENYTLDELSNLAKAARDNKLFGQSQALYKTLQQQDPTMKIGFLGGALAAVDARDYPAAAAQISEYRSRFGVDTDIQAAESYMKTQSQPLTERMAQLQQQLSATPDDKATILQLYRTAAQLRAFPVQEDLITRYPKLFSETDRLWLQESKGISQYRTAKDTSNTPQLQAAFDSLSEVVTKSKPGSDLNTQALRDRMAVAISLGNDKQALADYNTLIQRGQQPEYVLQQYADALSINGSPTTVRKIYDDIAARQKTASGAVSPAISEKLIQSNADSGYYSKAQAISKDWNPKKRVNDFTHTSQIDNPYYAKQYFWNARLEAWNGNIKGAIQLMDSWLAEHPGDPWAMGLRGELAQWNGREEEAKLWFERAKQQIPSESQAWFNANIGHILTEQGNWAGLEEMAAHIKRDDPEYAGFWKAYDAAHAAQLNVSYGVSRTTAPKDSGNEWVENATLYSPRSAGGHRAYVTQQASLVPNHGHELRYGRVGVGGEYNLNPVTLNAEAGHGTQLNDKAYFSAGASWRVNDQVNLSAKAMKNSPNTPAKALSQNVYANEYTVNANYTPSANTRFGAGAGVMTFDDDNVRKSVYGWVSQVLLQHDRWKLDGSAWADYGSNKTIPTAAYYNPKNNKSLSGNLDLSYFIPLSNGSRLTQHVNGGIGRYWQAGQNAENTWLWKYGHDWNIGKNVGLAYEIGRKQAIYDGSPEFQNFGNVNLNVKFK